METKGLSLARQQEQQNQQQHKPPLIPPLPDQEELAVGVELAHSSLYAGSISIETVDKSAAVI